MKKLRYISNKIIKYNGYSTAPNTLSFRSSMSERAGRGDKCRAPFPSVKSHTPTYTSAQEARARSLYCSCCTCSNSVVPGIESRGRIT